MPTYSVAEAKNQLPTLLDRAIAGEEVVITRRGKTVARIVADRTPTPSPDGPKSPTDVEWIRRRQVTPKIQIDGGELVRKMRDDYRY